MPSLYNMLYVYGISLINFVLVCTETRYHSVASVSDIQLIVEEFQEKHTIFH